MKHWSSIFASLLIIGLITLALTGCGPGSSGEEPQTAADSGNNTPANLGGSDTSDNGSQSGGNESSSPGSSDSDHPDTPAPGKDNEEPAKDNEEPGKDSEVPDKTPDAARENEAFRIITPEADTVIDGKFVVTGQARVFEASFGYTFEDGHEVLAEGFVQASMGAPEWGDFSFTIDPQGASNTTGTLTLYEVSAKDGSKIHQLTIPIPLDPKLMPKTE